MTIFNRKKITNVPGSTLPAFQNPPKCPAPKGKEIYLDIPNKSSYSIGPKSKEFDIETGASELSRRQISQEYVNSEIKIIQKYYYWTIALTVLNLLICLLNLLLF